MCAGARACVRAGGTKARVRAKSRAFVCAGAGERRPGRHCGESACVSFERERMRGGERERMNAWWRERERKNAWWRERERMRGEERERECVVERERECVVKRERECVVKREREKVCVV